MALGRAKQNVRDQLQVERGDIVTRTEEEVGAKKRLPVFHLKNRWRLKPTAGKC